MTAIAVVRSDQIVDKSISSSNKKSDLLGLIVGVIHIAGNSNSEGGGNSDSSELSKESERTEKKDVNANKRPISPNVNASQPETTNKAALVGRHSNLLWERAKNKWVVIGLPIPKLWQDVEPLTPDEIARIEWSINGLIEMREQPFNSIRKSEIMDAVEEIELRAVMLIMTLDPSRISNFRPSTKFEFQRLSYLQNLANWRVSFYTQENRKLNMKHINNLRDRLRMDTAFAPSQMITKIINAAVDVLKELPEADLHKLEFLRPFMQSPNYVDYRGSRTGAIAYWIVRTLVPEHSNDMPSDPEVKKQFLRFTDVINKERILDSFTITKYFKENMSDQECWALLKEILREERLRLLLWLLSTTEDLVSALCRDKVVAR